LSDTSRPMVLLVVVLDGSVSSCINVNKDAADDIGTGGCEEDGDDDDANSATTLEDDRLLRIFFMFLYCFCIVFFLFFSEFD